MKQERDSIDFGTMDISHLFRKMFIPTLLGMVLTATITIADGIFVGRGVGSDALASVNIVAPFFMLATGIGLMFGIGVSVVASIHLSHNKTKAANINVTQAFTVSAFFMLIASALVMLFSESVALLLGSSERLLPLVLEYLHWIVPFLVFNMFLSIGLFVIRLDGSPNFAMLCSAVPAVVNVVLDYILIFPLGLGLSGAAIASNLATLSGSIMILVYMTKYSKTLHFYRPKFTRTSLRLTARNTCYMVKLGFSAFLNEAAIACMMLVGNYVFMHYLNEDGVAAFSVACYCFPIVFMVNNAIAQSVQPIISYNHGIGNTNRIRSAFHLSIRTALLFGLITNLGVAGLCPQLTSSFLGNSVPAYQIAVEGIPYFTCGFIFFALNIVCIGYLQSLERFRSATVFTLLRGVILMILCFFLLPYLWGVIGIWLAVPLSELLTLLSIGVFFLFNKRVVKSI